MNHQIRKAKRSERYLLGIMRGTRCTKDSLNAEMHKRPHVYLLSTNKDGRGFSSFLFDNSVL